MWVKLLGYLPDASWQPLYRILNNSERRGEWFACYVDLPRKEGQQLCDVGIS